MVSQTRLPSARARHASSVSMKKSVGHASSVSMKKSVGHASSVSMKKSVGHARKSRLRPYFGRLSSKTMKRHGEREAGYTGNWKIIQKAGH